jgi:hypothetical protein
VSLTEADIAAERSNRDRATALDHPIAITFFRNRYANEKFERVSSIRRMVPVILRTNKSRKDFLPFLKLGLFGDLRTERDALRHDANVLTVSGAECDDDGEIIAMGQAAATLRRANIAALLYTSPSFTADRPRWRVLCPFSRELAPDQRAVMLARLNGVLNGVLTPESWTLSQSYYFGSVNHNPAHKVELVERDFLDLRPDLDASAIGDPSRHGGGGSKSEPYASPSELRASREAVEAALRFIPNTDDLSRIAWVRIGMAIKPPSARRVRTFGSRFRRAERSPASLASPTRPSGQGSRLSRTISASAPSIIWRRRTGGNLRLICSSALMTGSISAPCFRRPLCPHAWTCPGWIGSEGRGTWQNAPALSPKGRYLSSYLLLQ